MPERAAAARPPRPVGPRRRGRRGRRRGRAVARHARRTRRAAAFFDVDNTIMQGASIFHLARGLHRRKFFTTRDILGAAWKQAYFRVVGVEDPEHVAEARASALAFIAGHTVDELEDLSEEIFDEAMAHRIWPGTRALAQLHLDQGQRVWLVTAAPIEIATIIARRLGLTGALGTVVRARRRRLHRQAGRRHAARPGQGGGGQGAGRARGPRPAPAARPTPTPTTTCRCSSWSATRARSTRTRKLRAHARAAGLAGPGLPDRAQGRPGRLAGGRGRRGGDRRGRGRRGSP